MTLGNRNKGKALKIMLADKNRCLGDTPEVYKIMSGMGRVNGRNVSPTT